MTYLLSVDPGGNSGIALGYYDAITPYRLLERWQVHGGADGFRAWWYEGHVEQVDEIVCELFILDPGNQFTADLTPKLIEGAIPVLLDWYEHRFGRRIPVTWQPRTDKAALTGYPKEAKTKAQRQRVRFDFLDRFGLFKPGTENDDSNDAITHALVYLKRRLHMPSILAMWPPRTATLKLAA